ncbi:hypothetical protein FRB93_006408 [Tulasnella sp. JGI-2019a]|nr:hypothetical protein FRB93_006408 [Tulasnella sp. JGI-2019a]
MDETVRDGGTPILGLDVGTGASAIYPLLACRMRGNWHMAASELDETSITYAQENISKNGFDDRIKLSRASASGHVLSPIFDEPQKRFDFTICNPPFYSSKEDVLSSAEAKLLDPHSVCTGADVEMITDGGEVGFVGRIVKDSVELRDRCRWYTSLLGKSSSIVAIVELLKHYQVDNYGITEFDVGKTKRWAVAWSFGTDRLPDSLVRISKPQLASVMPARNELQITLSRGINLVDVEKLLSDVLGSLSAVEHHSVPPPDGKGGSFQVQAWAHSWSRSARRQQQQNKQAQIDHNAGQRPILRCRISWWSETKPQKEQDRVVQCRWIEGKDRQLFESFWGHVSRKAFDAVQKPV